DRWGDFRCVDQRRSERRAQEGADFVATEEERFHALPEIFNPRGAVERRQPRRLLGPIRQGGRIERENLRARSFIEALAGLFADPSTFDQLIDQLRNGKCPSEGIVAAGATDDVARNLSEDVDAGNVHGPERRAARAAQYRSGDGINLLDRVLARLERP